MDMQSDNYDICYYKGIVYEINFDNDKAISEFTNAISFEPKNSGAYFERAVVYDKQGKYSEAIDDYTNAIKYNKKFSDAYFNRASDLQELKLYENAIIDYSKAVELNPEDPETLNLRGVVKYNIEDHDGAMRGEYLVEMAGRQIAVGIDGDRLLRAHHRGVDEAAQQHDAGKRHIHDADLLVIDRHRPVVERCRPGRPRRLFGQLAWFLDDLERLKLLGPEKFQNLIANRLERMGLGVQLVGNVFRKDGGIDIIGYPRSPWAFPFLLAVQTKHHQTARKTGAPDVRDFNGVLTSRNSPFHMGMIVTNTSFTADATWFAENNQTLMRLRDLQDLRRWLRNDFINESEWREIPNEVEVAPGIRIAIPKPKSVLLK
jgi:hypothetical protein